MSSSPLLKSGLACAAFVVILASLAPGNIAAPAFERFADKVGLPDGVLRILLSIFAGYPCAFIFRKCLLNTQTAEYLKHIYIGLTGISIAYFAYGSDVCHSFVAIAVTYLSVVACPDLPGKKGITAYLCVAIFGFVFNFGYLMVSYYLSGSTEYDISYTIPHSVLTLRLIGFSIDVYDGKVAKVKAQHLENKDSSPSASVVTPDAADDNALLKIPSPLEVFAFNYACFGFMIGPQFSFQLYKNFVTLECFRTESNGAIVVPQSSGVARRCFATGLFYMAAYQVGQAFFPASSLLRDPVFLQSNSVWWRILYCWIAMKIVLMKYLGCWQVNEGVCILGGISFNGYDKQTGKAKWDRLTNILPLKFETAASLGGDVIQSFNINTNQWVKHYVFKRLRFLGNKHLSSVISLAFLALWHGFHAGYFMTFFAEFMDIDAERRLSARFGKSIHRMVSGNAVLRSIYNIFCIALTSLVLCYGTIPFELLQWDASIKVYQSLYFIGHIAAIGVILLDIVLPRPSRRHNHADNYEKTADHGNKVPAKND